MTRLSLIVVASAVLCVSAFLGTALASSSATSTNYTLHQGDMATWPGVNIACQLVSNGQTTPLVCGRATPGKGFGVLITRSKITVYNRTGAIVFQQKR